MNLLLGSGHTRKHFCKHFAFDANRSLLSLHEDNEDHITEAKFWLLKVIKEENVFERSKFKPVLYTKDSVVPLDNTVLLAFLKYLPGV